MEIFEYLHRALTEPDLFASLMHTFAAMLP